MKHMSASKEDQAVEAAVQPSQSPQTKKCTCLCYIFRPLLLHFVSRIIDVCLYMHVCSGLLLVITGTGKGIGLVVTVPPEN